MEKIKHYSLILLKLAISVGLLYWVVAKADAGKILDIMASANSLVLFLALILFLLITLVLTYRWMYMSRPFNHSLSFNRLLRYYLYSYYFNNFLPTSIGGDIVRAIKIGKDLDSRSSGLASVLIDRIMGILATLTFATLGLFWTAHYFKSLKIINFAIVFTVFVVLLMNILLNPVVYDFFKRNVFRRLSIFNLGERIIKVLESVHLYREEKSKLIIGYLMALCAQSLTVILNYVIALAMGIDISLGFLFFAIPVSFLVSLAPSINGLGVRDWSYVLLLSKVGVPPAKAVGISLLVIGIQIFVSLFGGLLWAFEKDKTEINHMVEEL